MDLEAYRQSAEAFLAELTTEYYRHYAGLQDEYEIEPIYARHGGLFTREAVESLRVLADRGGTPPESETGRRLRMLVDFAVEGYVGQQTKAVEAELARREAALQVAVEGEAIGFRESSVVQANEADAGRRAAIERARLELLAGELQPLYAELIERQHAAAEDLGWRSYREMCEQCKALDLGALHADTRAFRAATDAGYAPVLEPELQRTLGLGLHELARSDLPRFFRAPDQDSRFPAERLLAGFTATLDGLGIDVLHQAGVTLDLEPRPNKSPRAFCAPVHTPGEVYLMLTPVGGRDDYSVLLHEGGHTEHAAHVDPELPFEFRCLGDNAITECFAFLFQHLLDAPAWLRERLGVEDPSALVGYARAHRLVYLRRYTAKLAYELELHAAGADLGPARAARYAQLLGDAVGVAWPADMYLADVDPGFYSACYLRAWALETQLRTYLRERYGERWFACAAAGEELQGLWREGQRLTPEELLQRLGGSELTLRTLLPDVGLQAASASSAQTR